MRNRLIYFAMIIVVFIVFIPIFETNIVQDKDAFELIGDWEFYDEMLLDPMDFYTKEVPLSQVINLPRSFMGNVFKKGNVNTYGTLKKDFFLYDFSKGDILAIENSIFREACKIWIDGELIINTGDIATNPIDSKYIKATSFGEFKVKEKKIEVIIQFSKFNYYNFSSSGLSISTMKKLIINHTREIGLNLFMLGSIMILCIYHLLFYFKSKTFGNKTGALYFSLLFLMIALRIISIGDYFIIELIPNISFEIISKFGFWSFYLLLPLLILFSNEIVLGLYSEKYIKFNKYIMYFGMILVLVLDFNWYLKLIIPYIFYMIFSVFYVAYINIKNYKETKSSFRLLWFGFFIAILALFSDFLYISNIYREQTFSYLGTVAFMLIISIIISNKYNEVFDKVQILAYENKLYFDEIRENNIDLEKKIESRTHELKEAFDMLEIYSNEMKKILNNVGQGFLTIDKDLKISGEFSKECFKIFGENITSKDISKKLFAYNIEQEMFFRTIVEKIYSTDEMSQSDLYLSLLPSESNIRGRIYSLNYKIIKEKNAKLSIMLILTDITERRDLEYEMLIKQDLLNMIVNVVIHYDEFISLISSYMSFCKIEISEIMNGKTDFASKLFDLLKEIHTYKGLFSRFGMLETANLIHSLETEIFEIREEIEQYTPKSVLKLLNEYDIYSYTNKDMSNLKEKLGKTFLNDKNYIKVNRDSLDNLIEEVKNSNCSKKLVNEVKKLKLVSFKKLFGLYPDFITSLSVEMGKQILPMKIEGDDFEIESRKYSKIIKSLVHVYKNAISHGIEFEDDRVAKGKKAYGSIRTIIEDRDRINITIEDDGCGISVKEVKEILISKYKYSEDYFVSKTENEILKMIFKSGYTSLDSQSIISGRGVGLASFIDEVEKIGGNIKIETKKDEYTRIIIDLPKFDLEDDYQIEKHNFINSITKSVCKIISKYMGHGLIGIDKEALKIDGSKISMFKYSSYMEVRGDVTSKLLFSFDDGALIWIKRVLGLEDEDISDELIEDSVAEITNIVLGNSSNLISEYSSNIIVGMPVVITDITSINLSRFDVYKFEINDFEFNMKICIVFDKE